MEVWEKEYIDKHLNLLVNFTDCSDEINDSLVSATLLTDHELEILGNIRRHEGRTKESFQLYKFLQSKPHAYAKFTKLLLEEGQLPAAKLLLQGFWSNGIPRAFPSCEIKMNFEDILSASTSFQGQTLEINKILEKMGVEDAEAFLESFLDERDYFEIFIAKEKEFQLLRDTVPRKPSSAYIARKVRTKQNGECFTEDELLTKILDGAFPRVLGISGQLGSGRSFLLTSLARKIQKRDPTEIVVFLSLSKILESWGKVAPEDDSALALLLDLVCPSSLSKEMIKRMLNQKLSHLSVMVDGFEEALPQQISMVISFLKAISSTQVNLIVTSKPETDCELESMDMPIYSLEPLTATEQVELLSQHWKHALSFKEDKDKLLETFSKACLYRLENSLLTSPDELLIEPPLKCFLLAKMCWTDVKAYAEQGDKFLTDFHLGDSITTYTLFHKFFQSNRAIRDALDGMKLQNRKFFFRLKALHQLFPSSAEAYSQYARIYDSNSSNLLSFEKQKSKNRPVLHVHHTFPEYLIAELFTELLVKRTLSTYRHVLSQEKLMESLVQHMLSTHNETFQPALESYAPIPETISTPEQFLLSRFQNSGIIYFLNEHVRQYKTHSYDHFIINDFFASISPPNLHQLLQACFYGGYQHLVSLIRELLKRADIDHVQRYRVYLTGEASPRETQTTLIRRCMLLIRAASHSENMVHECFTLFQECFQCNLNHVCEKLPLWMKTPLHTALQKGDIIAAKYLLHKIHLSNRSLLYYAVGHSYADSEEAVQKRIAICRLLLVKEENLIEEVSYDLQGNSYESPLVANKIHPEIIHFLVENGANLLAAHKRETVLHKAARYMSPRDFHKFCRFLVDVGRNWEIFLRNDKWKSPIHSILQFAKNLQADTVQMLYRRLDVDVNEKDDMGNNSILSAVAGNQSLLVIVALIEQGADITALNEEGKGVLQLALESENQELFEYFTSCGLSLEQE